MGCFPWSKIVLCFREQPLPAAQWYSPAHKPNLSLPDEVFHVYKCGDVSCGPHSAYDLDCSPAASFGAFARDKGVTEALADGSQWAVRLLSLASSDCRELSAEWEISPRKSAGNIIRWWVQGEPYAATVSLV